MDSPSVRGPAGPGLWWPVFYEHGEGLISIWTNDVVDGLDGDLRDVMAAAVLRESVLTGRRTSRAVGGVLRREGLTLDEWLVLGTLDGSDRPEGTTMTELRRATVIDKATLGRRVDDLVSRALVYREVDDGDRRVIRVYLSSRGRDVLARLTALLSGDDDGDAPDQQ